MSHYVTLMFDVEDLCWPARILLHTRLQCWTLRPALAQDEQRRAT